jgi:hypothetical protein
MSNTFFSNSTIFKKIKDREYISHEPVLQDVKWIYHNCCIYNGGWNIVLVYYFAKSEIHFMDFLLFFSAKTRLAGVASNLVKIITNEIKEMETCTDCYMNMLTKSKSEWFTDLCVNFNFKIN